VKATAPCAWCGKRLRTESAVWLVDDEGDLFPVAFAHRGACADAIGKAEADRRAEDLAARVRQRWGQCEAGVALLRPVVG